MVLRTDFVAGEHNHPQDHNDTNAALNGIIASAATKPTSGLDGKVLAWNNGSALFTDATSTIQGWSVSVFAAPTTDFSGGGHKGINFADPVSATDLTTMQWVQAAITAALPPQSPCIIVFDSVNNVYPVRASITTDLTQPVIWVGPNNNRPLITTGYAVNNVDFFWGY